MVAVVGQEVSELTGYCQPFGGRCAVRATSRDDGRDEPQGTGERHGVRGVRAGEGHETFGRADGDPFSVIDALAAR